MERLGCLVNEESLYSRHFYFVEMGWDEMGYVMNEWMDGIDWDDGEGIG